MTAISFESEFRALQPDTRNTVIGFLRQQSRLRACKASVDELIALALVSDTTVFKSHGEILFWIANFVDPLKDEVIKCLEDKGHMNIPGRSLSDQIRDRLTEHDLHINRKIDQNDIFSCKIGCRYTGFAITPFAACVALKRIIQPRHDTSFPFKFMQLPPEIRCLIYSNLLSFSSMVLSLTRDERGRPLMLFTPRSQHNKRLDSFERLSVSLRPSRSLLAIVAVSKQISKEAIAIFYGQNHFFAESMPILGKFLENIGTDRRRSLVHLSFNYPEPWDIQSRCRPSTCFKSLLDCRNLRRLDILGIRETQFMSADDAVRPFGAPKACKQPSSIPGFTTLARLRGLHELTFELPCPRLEAWLRPKITAPRDGDERSKSGSKKKKKEVKSARFVDPDEGN